jgi:methyltransferase (TIGR00027 family)
MHSTKDNILQSGKASQSALRVAIARAVHQLLDEPIVFEDPMALRILGRQIEQAVRDDPFEFNDTIRRTMRAALVARSRLAEDELRRAVQDGVRQYVVLGAGLDTFALRNPYQASGLRIYEADHPATQRWKQATLADAAIGIPESAAFVAVDFEKDSLAEKLRQAGFRADAPACFSWLGVSVYLTNEAVLETLAFVARLPKGSSIAFDYRIPASMLNPMERMMEEYVANMFAAMGEPWKSSFEPGEFQQMLGDIGFSDLENFGPAELNARYFHRRKDGLQTGGGGFRFMCARV